MLSSGAPEFSAWFSSFRRSCFRLETLQHYTSPIEDELARAFNAGDSPAPHAGKRDWMELVDVAVVDGRVMQRVHVVREPVTSYVAFEIAWSYAYNVAAGEDVRIIPVPDTQRWPVGVSQQDFWLFDDTELFDMRYTPDGVWVGVEHVDEDAALWACEVRATALKIAVPWQEYVDAHPELAQRVPVVQWQR